MIQTITPVVSALLSRGLTAATAESCTGGLLAAAFTDVPGVSGCFKGGVVSYANEIKENILGVPGDILRSVGAVSRECAAAMSSGVRSRFDVDFALSTTGIAGPGGGTPEKPVGLVYISVASAQGVKVDRCLFSGSRNEIREAAVRHALLMLGRELGLADM